MSSELFATLQQGLQSLALELTDQQQQKLIDFVELLYKWNRVYNLTAVRDTQQMVRRHLLDSLAVVPYVHGQHIIDLGSGAGLPGIPLAIALPTKYFVLIDSQLKKTRFLQQAVTELALANVEIVCSRIETYTPQQRFDSVISRALTSLPQMLQWSAHLLAENGVWLAMKGSYPHDEVEQLAKSFEIKAVHQIALPQQQEQRLLIELMPTKSQKQN